MISQLEIAYEVDLQEHREVTLLCRNSLSKKNEEIDSLRLEISQLKRSRNPSRWGWQENALVMSFCVNLGFVFYIGLVL